LPTARPDGLGLALCSRILHTRRRNGRRAGPGTERLVNEPRNILVGMIGAAGDVILSTPLLESLDTAYPYARVTYLVGRRAAPALRHLELVDNLIELNDSGSGRLADLRAAWQVRKGRFDLSIMLDRSDKLAAMAWMAGIPRRIGFEPARAAWAVSQFIPRDPDVHRTAYLLGAAEVLGIPPPARIRLHYARTRPESERAQGTLRNAGVQPKRDVIVAICPGSGSRHWRKRRWDVRRFAGLADHAIRRGWKPVVIAGADEAGMLEGIGDGLHSGILRYQAEDLRDMGAILGEATIVVSNDSLPVHLGGALGKPVLAVYGYSDRRHWGPLGNHDRIVQLDLPCSPCPPDFPCDRDFECLRELPVERVSGVLDEMMSAEAADSGSRG